MEKVDKKQSGRKKTVLKKILLCGAVLSLALNTGCGMLKFGKGASEKNASVDISQIEGEKITIDDYEIIMTKSVYDDMNYEAYCEFSVIKNGGKDKVAYKDLHSINGANVYFGEDQRFRFMQKTGTGSIQSDITFQEKGNVLNMEYTLSIDADEYDGRLYIFDKQCGGQEDVDNCTQYFELKATEDSKEFTDEEKTVRIQLSTRAIKIISEQAFDEKSLTVWLETQDGNRYDIMTNGNTAKGVDDFSRGYSERTLLYDYKVSFEKPINVQEIVCVNLNGVEYR